MTDRKEISVKDIAIAWKKSGGKITDGHPVGTAKCPYPNCKFGLMQANEYGKSHPSSWTVDHIKPVSKGGDDNPSNLQAMHKWCNSDKGDKY